MKKSCKTYENALIYDISYETSTGAKPLCIKLDQIDGFIKITVRIRYLVLLTIGGFIKFAIWLNIL